jgi:hypothetical protein
MVMVKQQTERAEGELKVLEEPKVGGVHIWVLTGQVCLVELVGQHDFNMLAVVEVEDILVVEAVLGIPRQVVGVVVLLM